MIIYLDNCVLNRPFDDQSQARIKEETEAVFEIRRRIELALVELAWSYVIDYETSRNPFADRRRGSESWKSLSIIEIEPSIKIMAMAIRLRSFGLKEIDALHIACALEAKSSYFITTDDAILKKTTTVSGLSVVCPMDFLKEIV